MKKEKVVELIVKPIFMLLFIAAFVLLVVSTSQNWGDAFQSVVMVLILVMSLLATLYPLIKKEKTSIPEMVFVFLCFSLLVASVIVFASLATDKYKDPVTQISAACVGGLLSLYGIGLTIKYNRLEKEKDVIEKAKPNVFPIGEQMWASLDKTSKNIRDIEIRTDLSTLEKAKRGDKCYEFVPIYLANSDLSMCTFKGIVVNDNETIVFQYDNVLLKGNNNCFILDYCFKYIDEIESIQLVLGDMLGNTYGCYVSFDLENKNNRNKTPIYIKGTRKIQPLDAKMFPVSEKLN